MAPTLMPTQPALAGCANSLGLGCTTSGTVAASAPIVLADTFLDPTTFTRDEVRLIQDALIWTGSYHGLKDGVWGKSTIESVGSWRRASNLPPAVVFRPEELTSLLSQAEVAKTAIGWTTLKDPNSGAAIGVPAKLVTLTTLADGASYSGTNGIDFVIRRYSVTLSEVQSALAAQAAGPDVKHVTYRLDKPTRQVLAYDTVNGFNAYIRLDQVGNEWRGFSARVRQGVNEYSNIVIAFSGDFDASGQVAPLPDQNNEPHLYTLAQNTKTREIQTAGDPASYNSGQQALRSTLQTLSNSETNQQSSSTNVIKPSSSTDTSSQEPEKATDTASPAPALTASQTSAGNAIAKPEPVHVPPQSAKPPLSPIARALAEAERDEKLLKTKGYAIDTSDALTSGDTQNRPTSLSWREVVDKDDFTDKINFISSVVYDQGGNGKSLRFICAGDELSAGFWLPSKERVSPELAPAKMDFKIRIGSNVISPVSWSFVSGLWFKIDDDTWQTMMSSDASEIRVGFDLLDDVSKFTTKDMLQSVAHTARDCARYMGNVDKPGR